FRGRICFWNGHTGTQLESFLSHKADILCLCLDEENNCVYSSGVDPVITNFTRIRLKCGDYQGVKNKWVRSIQRRIHTHDVRALVLADNKLYSAGVDSYLAMSSFPPKALHKYAPTLQ
ncbi:unnamed protein product, partial [Timema podura]|nr:unnamed protein product [Timema podura]